jgi:hypothetical protein
MSLKRAFTRPRKHKDAPKRGRQQGGAKQPDQ